MILKRASQRGRGSIIAAAVLVATLASLAGSWAGASGDPLGQGALAWRQVFGDEFEGSALDRGRWYPSRWFAAHCAPGATPGELQYYTDRPANVSVSGGYLHLTARREQFNCGEGAWAGTKAYTSGWVQTGGSDASDGSEVEPGFTLGLGYAEARFKVPPGKGLWSAFWMLPVRGEDGNEYPTRPEIDNLEILGDSADVWRLNLHLLGGIDENHHFDGPDTTAGWHTIGVWRKANRIQWFADGRPIWSYSGPSIPGAGVRMYLILNLVPGGDYPGIPDAATKFPAEFLVDYVRAWEQAPLPPATQNTPPSVRLTEPTPGSRLRSPLSLSAEASDDSGLSSVQFWLDSRRVAVDFGPPFKAGQAIANTLPAGLHTVSARAVDGHGVPASSAVTVYRGLNKRPGSARKGPGYRVESRGLRLTAHGPRRGSLRVTLKPCSPPARKRRVVLRLHLTRKGTARRRMPGRLCVVGLRPVDRRR